MTALPTMNRRTFLNASIATAACTVLPQVHGETLPATLADAAAGGSNITPKWKDEGVLDLTNSPFAKLKTVPIRAVVIEGLLVSAPRYECEFERPKHARGTARTRPHG